MNMPRTSEESLKLLTDVVWQADGNEGNCPPDRYPTFRQLDDLITTTAWGAEAREEFAQRWHAVESTTDRRFEALNFAELAHLVWDEAAKKNRNLKHPLAPLISAWQSGPLEVQAVRTSNGNLRADVIMPRVAMRRNLNSGTDRLYMTPAYGGTDAEGSKIALPGFKDGLSTGRIPVLPVNLYDLGVEAGEARGGRGAAPIAARMLVKLAAAPSATVRHGERFVTYRITLGDLRTALYPTEYLDGRQRQPPKVSRMWPRILAAIRVINQEASIPILDPKTGYGHYHHLLRISENFGRIDLNMPIHVVLDIPPEVEGGVQLPKRLDHWGAESAPAYRALLGLSFLWHEPGRTHAPIKGGRWVRRTGLDPYDPLEDDDVIALAFPNTRVRNKSVVIRRAWDALERLEEYGELRIEGRRILPPDDESASESGTLMLGDGDSDVRKGAL
jgi:hypothetical protein